MKAKNKARREHCQKMRFAYRYDWGLWRRWVRRREVWADHDASDPTPTPLDNHTSSES